ncbi:MAG: MFS transporter [Angelakisella sp.]|jgi:UMF1 family MFS transporter|nr:MFS transporter [Angelakisella sp.]
MTERTRLTRTEISWILYDVANSAFIMLVSTTIPIYFATLVEEAGMDTTTASGLWGLVTAAAVLILAVLSPILGAVADYKGMKKRLFIGFLVMGLAGAVSLALAPDWLWFLFIFVAARLGYSACNVFYDSMLTDVTTDERMDMVSSHGYAWGYIGSCAPFIIGIVVLFVTGMSATGFQISFLITAAWWLLMSIPLLKNVHQAHYLPGRPESAGKIFRQVGATFLKIRKNKRLLCYILGYFCYIDGVYTIISMATAYGNELGIDTVQMILALLLTQFVAFPCAILSGILAKKHGPLKLIKVFILAYIAICLFGYQLDKVWEFWVLAVAVGTCQGGIQALSRSYYGKLIPKEESNEYFGFFDIFGKFADFIGPLIISFCALVLGSSTYGILALVVLFVAGYLLVRKAE